ncbi:MAG: hypothetical protein MUO80_08905 [Dehalococcoidia bacterium]|nr:hypothetical protein [Dehalococcoidia bacterium]
MDRPFQRKGAISNTHVGREFEIKAREFFARQGIILSPGFVLAIGTNGKRQHKFDLGDQKKKVIVECKSHKWTEGGNAPSSKIRAWNEAMYLFYAAPSNYRKILFVLRDYSEDKMETLAEYYIRTSPHLIPAEVEIWEYDEATRIGERVN